VTAAGDDAVVVGEDEAAFGDAMVAVGEIVGDAVITVGEIVGDTVVAVGEIVGDAVITVGEIVGDAVVAVGVLVGVLVRMGLSGIEEISHLFVEDSQPWQSIYKYRQGRSTPQASLLFWQRWIAISTSNSLHVLK
jgi:hypothetical protein